MDKWLSKLESSNWLSHVKDILTCACMIAQCIDSEGNILTCACTIAQCIDSEGKCLDS